MEPTDDPYTPPTVSGLDISQAEKDLRLWAMFLHLSQLVGYVTVIGAPVGMIAPILIWQLKKNDLPGLDVHGKNVTNWIISSLIYFMLCGVLLFVFLGIPLMVALGVLMVVFPIIGGIKANNGEVWKCPLTIEFIK